MKTKTAFNPYLVFWLVMSFGFWGVPAAAGESPGGKAEMPDTYAGETAGQLTLYNADIQDVLRLIAEEYDLNIVMSDQVAGTVTLRLKDTSLINTLDAILLARGYDYEIRDNIIRVAPAEVVEAEREKRLTKQEQVPLASEVLTLRYLDANDLEPVVKSMLTARGTVRVLERRSYKGFQFGSSGGSQSVSYSSSSGSSGVSNAGDMGGLIRSRSGDAEQLKPRSNTLMIVDVPAQVESIVKMIAKIDIPPRQVLIDAKILEVDTDTLEDMGIDFNNRNSLSVSGDRSNSLQTDMNSGDSDTDINTGIFSEIFPTNTDAGFHAFFERLNGEDFSVILHALLQDERTKTLSAPQILTIENQEAAILIGEQFPVFEANVTDQGTTTESLAFFQPVGISLQVIVQVTPDDDISMIIHPTVSSIGQMVTGTTGLQQPRINIREADTRVIMNNGETLVIGGLLEDVMSEQVWGIPLLKDIPFFGKMFTRRQIDVDQRNLLIFITPKIMDLNSAKMNDVEKMTFQGIQDPARYGFLHNRRQALRTIYDAAKANYEKGHETAARAQFLQIYRIDPHHDGAIRYLKKMDALPEQRPVG